MSTETVTAPSRSRQYRASLQGYVILMPKAKFTGWAFERDETGKITHVIARLAVEKDGKTAKGQTRWYTSGGFLNVENEADEKMSVSCTVFKAKK